MVPEPLLSRFRVFRIGPFPENRLPDLVERILKKIVEGLGLEGVARFCVREEVLESLRSRTAREIRQVLEGAVARRLIDIPEGIRQTFVLRKQDFEVGQRPETRARIGFKRRN